MSLTTLCFRDTSEGYWSQYMPERLAEETEYPASRTPPVTTTETSKLLKFIRTYPVYWNKSIPFLGRNYSSQYLLLGTPPGSHVIVEYRRSQFSLHFDQDVCCRNTPRFQLFRQILSVRALETCALNSRVLYISDIWAWLNKEPRMTIFCSSRDRLSENGEELSHAHLETPTEDAYSMHARSGKLLAKLPAAAHHRTTWAWWYRHHGATLWGGKGPWEGNRCGLCYPHQTVESWTIGKDGAYWSQELLTATTTFSFAVYTRISTQ